MAGVHAESEQVQRAASEIDVAVGNAGVAQRAGRQDGGIIRRQLRLPGEQEKEQKGERGEEQGDPDDGDGEGAGGSVRAQFAGRPR